MTTYADIGRVLTPAELQTLKRNGIDGLNLYLDPFNEKGRWGTQYLRDIAAAGMRVGGFFYETTGGSGDPGYFTTERGAADARWAEQLLADLHAAAPGLLPDKVVVWFTEDEHLQPPDLFDPYANGIAPESVPEVRRITGVYGYEDLIERARALYPWEGKHLVQTYGQVTGQLDAWQHEQTTIEGITVDLDDETFAGFVPGGVTDMTPEQILALLASPAGVAAVKAAIVAKGDGYQGYGWDLQTELEQIQNGLLGMIGRVNAAEKVDAAAIADLQKRIAAIGAAAAAA